ncbi:glucose-6-phosphate isomerase [Mycoplasmopsis lipofaciens]|uniref:glucose-6-phosphate isomerase n=1 Tax=Mycoplasmopsis lipofaciens TaxID=114884 RepID=UPI000489F000|nr:glucose-6-phosphate isomerase [Mycoplasmopsis lipofaciens]
MKLLNLNLNDVVSEKELLSYEQKVLKIHNALKNKTVLESNWLGWMTLPNNIDSNEIQKMHQIVNKWEMQKVEIVVVIGIGGSYLGAKSGYEFIYGEYSQKRPKMELLFAGNSISAESLIAQLQYVENKKFAINVISKSGTTLEPSIAFREFRKLLETKVGSTHAKDLIVATTDSSKGVLYDLAIKKGYEKLVIPNDVGGRFSVLSPVGLFPFLCAGLDINNLLKGAQQANKDADEINILKNDAFKYAIARHILAKKYKVEMMISYEPKMQYFSEWWKQLYGESEGKDNKGLFPTSGIFSTDLHSLGQMIQEGSKILFETILILDKPKNDIVFEIEKENDDKLNYLDGKTLHEVNWTAFKGTLEAHKNTGGVPNITMTFNSFDELTLGYLFQFFERSLAISAYLLGVNPFNQPGVEVYKSNMFKMLKDDK